MKLAIEIKKEMKEKIELDLRKRGFEISYNSMGTMWVYDINFMAYCNDNSIEIENKELKTYRITLKDIDYMEVQKENK